MGQDLVVNLCSRSETHSGLGTGSVHMYVFSLYNVL